MSSDRKRYRQLCDTTEDIPIFCKDWYLDIICGQDNWEVVLVEEKDEIIAAWPIYQATINKYFSIIKNPPYAQFLTPWIKPITNPNFNEYKRTSYETKNIEQLIKLLPKFDYFNQSLHYSIRNWLPFHWAGFKQTTLYTYVIEDISNPENVLKSFASGKKQDIKKAQKILTIKDDMSSDIFFRLHKKWLKARDQHISYKKEFFNELVHTTLSRDAGRISYAEDQSGNILAAIYYIWDKESAYHLITTYSPEFKSSGAQALLIYDAIKFLSGKTKKYDFEGSMQQGIEYFYRSFGSVQKPYFRLSKTTSKLYKIKNAIKSVLAR